MKDEEHCIPGEYPVYTQAGREAFDRLMDDAARQRAQKVEFLFEKFGEVMDEL